MSAAQPDHYATLGLNRRCTFAQIRAAYRLLSKQSHPDINPNSPEAIERTQVLNLAYEILSDPSRRHAYNRDFDAARKPAAPSGRARLERNISQEVMLNIEELFHGASLEVRVNDPANPRGSEIYQLAIPVQTAPGARFRLPRVAPFEGGYVEVRVRVRPGFRFKPRGSDVRCELRIDYRRAQDGGTEIITGPAGERLSLKIPAHVARGAILRVPGAGLPKSRGGRGDLLVRISYRPEVRISRLSGR